MEADATATLERPDVPAEETPPAASEESASPPSDDISPESRAQMNALIRGGVGRLDSTSKPDAAEASADAAETPDGESAPAGDVKPSDAAALGPGRRGAAAEIDRLKAENERLTKALDAANPPPPDASEEARKAALETESRFRRLLMKPESDADWTPDDISFLETEKQRRAVAPELQQHYDTVLEADRASLQKLYDDTVNGFWAHVRSDMASAKDVPGVDYDAVKSARTFAERDRLMYAAGAASHEPELKKLREENADLRRDLFGATRAPMSGGRSSPGRAYSENEYMNRLLRGGRA